MAETLHPGPGTDGGTVPQAPTAIGSAEQQKQALRLGRGANRQAFVLVHGMGEQIPMDTVKSFVKTVWDPDPDDQTHKKLVWSKPDPRTGSLELRRLTTRNSPEGGSFPNGVRSDIFELYWADLTTGSTWDQFLGWVRYLLFRPLGKVPKAVHLAWFALWLATLLVTFFAVMSVMPASIWSYFAPDWARPIVLALAGAAGATIHKLATRSFGRVVRYTRAEPDNIAARAAVRDRGLKLLRKLHTSNEYERIVIVSHSLGTILAYDLVSYFWAEREKARTFLPGTPAFAALQTVEKTAADLEQNPTDITKAAYRVSQAHLRRLMSRDTTSPERAGWLISDFITLGSPLTHAEFLLANGFDDLQHRKEERELPTSPPFREVLEPRTEALAKSTGGFPINDPASEARLMSFPSRADPVTWTLHYAAPFAAVRWTNIHDKSRLIYKGDLIGGPLSPVFGPGISDIDLSVVDRPSDSFTHTKYWDDRQPAARLKVLFDALNINDE